MMNHLKILLIIITLAIFAHCGNSNSNNDDSNISVDSIINDQNLVVDDAAINEIIQSFSSPVEMAALLNDLNVPFNKKLLVTTDKADDYDTNFKKSLALGFLSADLGYLNVYNKTSQIVEYLTVIKRIADDLKIGQFFDFQTLKRLATSSDNLDSLLFLSVHSFHQMDQHLRNNQRSNLSALAITGVWLEGLYLITSVIKDTKNEDLRQRIGEQKIILKSLLPILKLYQKDNNFARLVDDFEELNEAYDGVEIIIKMTEPKSEVIDGALVITPGEESFVEMTDDQLQNIVRVTDKVRNKLIAL